LSGKKQKYVSSEWRLEGIQGSLLGEIYDEHMAGRKLSMHIWHVGHERFRFFFTKSTWSTYTEISYVLYV